MMTLEINIKKLISLILCYLLSSRHNHLGEPTTKRTEKSENNKMAENYSSLIEVCTMKSKEKEEKTDKLRKI